MENDTTFNGWKNYDTWKLALNLENINFNRALKTALKKDLNTFENRCIKTWHKIYFDKDIDYLKVDFKEIYDTLREYYEIE